MVVDDDPIRELVRLYLEKEGFEVTCAGGDEAMKMFRAAPNVLLDVMPGMEQKTAVCRSAQNIEHTLSSYTAGRDLRKSAGNRTGRGRLHRQALKTNCN